MRPLADKSDVRFVGDRDTMFVHDSRNPASEECFLQKLVEGGLAVGFEPDTLEQAFNEGFDYCDTCVGAEEPADLVSERRDSSSGTSRLS